MPRLYTHLLILLVLALAAYGSPGHGHGPPPAQGSTPEEAALRVIAQFYPAGKPPGEIRLGRSRVTPYGIAIPYTAGNQTEVNERSAMGFVLARERNGVWVTRHAQFNTLDYITTARSVYVRSTVMDLPERWELGHRVGAAYGRVRNSEVATVEVMFNDGQILHDTVTPDGMFVLLADGTFAYCRVRVFDAAGQVLETIDTEAGNGCTRQ